MNRVALIGYSGHSYVVADILEQAGYKIIGYFEKEIAGNNPLNLEYLGFEEDNDFVLKLKGASVFPSVGNNDIRKRIMGLISEREVDIAFAVSKKANISKNSVIGQGTLICQGVCINPLSVIGKGVILNTGSIIEHECIVGDFVHIAPGAVLAGKVHIGESSFIGANSVIKQNIKIGNNVTIGAGAVVLQDIPDNETWVGNPSKKIRL